MENLEEMHVALNIAAGAQCDLEHHDDEDHPAINAIMIPMGYHISDVVSEQVATFTVHICKECQDSLNTNDGWMLFYCTKCSGNQWVYIPHSRIKKGKYSKVEFLKYCPNCYEGEKK